MTTISEELDRQFDEEKILARVSDLKIALKQIIEKIDDFIKGEQAKRLKDSDYAELSEMMARERLTTYKRVLASI